GARGAGCGAAEGGYRACVLRDPAQGTARAIAAAKVDLDSTLDLVTAGDGFFAVYALSYAGAEVRYTVTRVDAPGTDLRSVAVADLDRDGLPDLVGADRAGSALRVASQGLGLTFDLGVPLASPHLRGPLAVAGADLDSNGVVDLAAADPGDPATGFGGNVCVFLGDAAGRYSGDALTPPPRPGAPPASPRAVAAADVDGDGRLDVVTADDGTHEVVVYRQGGRGTFRAPAEALAEGQVLPEPSSLAAFDSDGDARLDLLAASRPADALVLLRQTDGGDFAALQLPLPAPEGADDAGGMRRGPVAAAAGDLDGDALADIVAASVDSNDLTVLLRDAEGSYVLSDVKAEGFLGPHSVALADLDGDGLLDVACAARFSDEARWFRQGAGGSFAEAGAFRAPEGSPQKLLGPVFVAAGDVDSDGRADVVTANHRSGNLTIFLQAEEPEGRGTFGAPVEVPLGAGARPVALTLGRLGEGSGLDIATVNLGRAAASVVLQDGAGMLRVTSLGGLSGVQPTAIALRELGGDGRPDLAIAFSGASASFLQVRAQGAGAGEPAFDGVLRLAARELIAPAALIAADLDSDGEADLAAASRATRAITVFYGGR
ncbi:MAG: VCBS repeat-containing protein, partial [Planctomycetes bacterium]|nr:VCBS repeat-containing protein [Planctomycetota bacterium]